MIAHIANEDLLTKQQVIHRLKEALDNQTPYSMVRIGDGENFVLSQDAVYTHEQLMKELWPREANKGRKGVKFPNIALRDQLVEAARHADIVGILAQNDRVIRAHPNHKRKLTDKIFNHFAIEPKSVCNAIVNRELIYDQTFWEMLKGRRILLVSRWAGGLKQKLIQPPYQLTVAGAISFERYEQMEDTLQQIAGMKEKFDIALVSCGVNAVVLAYQIAAITGKVGVDFGIGSQIISMTHKK